MRGCRIIFSYHPAVFLLRKIFVANFEKLRNRFVDWKIFAPLIVTLVFLTLTKHLCSIHMERGHGLAVDSEGLRALNKVNKSM